MSMELGLVHQMRRLGRRTAQQQPVGVIAPAVTPAITSAADGASIAAEAVGEHFDRALRWTGDVALSIPDSQGDDHLRRAVGLDRTAAEE
jgi:hypothetical protein